MIGVLNSVQTDDGNLRPARLISLIYGGSTINGRCIKTGVTQPLECFRGEYNSSYTCYQGDTVTYQGSTYRFIYATPQSGRLPTNTTYWIITDFHVL
jgi:hypothetical protein